MPAWLNRRSFDWLVDVVRSWEPQAKRSAYFWILLVRRWGGRSEVSVHSREPRLST